MAATQTAPEPLRSFTYLGNEVKVHADASDTDGRFALLEMRAYPGSEPPMHIHQNEDEHFVVLEGKIKLTVGGFETILSAGDSAVAKKGTPHTFKILTPYVRTMAVLTPAGFEDFFRALAGETPPYERIAETAAHYGSRLLV